MILKWRMEDGLPLFGEKMLWYQKPRKNHAKSEDTEMLCFHTMLYVVMSALRPRLSRSFLNDWPPASWLSNP